MFTINIYLKFALIAIFLGGGIIIAITQGFWYSFPLLLIGVGLLISYILLGTVQSAGTFIQNSDFNAAEKRLGLTLKPEWLYVTNRAIFFILKGTIAAQDGDQKIAEDYFNKSLALKLPTDNERAMVLIQLASLHGNRQNMTGAKNYLNQAKKLKITEPQIKEQLQYIDKAIKQNAASLKQARSMGKQGMHRMQPGGKRRRPKSR